VNQRAIELYQQAVTFAYNTAGDDAGKGTIRESLTAGKFAELIVRECVQFIDTGADKFSDGDWLRTSVRDIGVMIKEHFEVED